MQAYGLINLMKAVLEDTHKFFAYNFRRFPSDTHVWAPGTLDPR